MLDLDAKKTVNLQTIAQKNLQKSQSRQSWLFTKAMIAFMLLQARQSPACTPLRGPSICIPPSRRGSSMTHPPPSYLDPNNVLTAWGSSAAQLGLQVNIPAHFLSPVPTLHVCMACPFALHVICANLGPALTMLG